MVRLLLLISLVLSANIALSNAEVSAQFNTPECKPYEIQCQKNVDAGCEPWDYLCGEGIDDCPFWKTNCNDDSLISPVTIPTQKSASIKYTAPVSCTLVLKSAIGGISGYCQETPGANLGHCITDKVGLLDPYTVKFLCADGRPDLMAKSARGEVRVDNLAPSAVFRSPYWIICDEDMRSMVTNKRCYDSEFSNRDDWGATCKVDKRISKVYEYPDTFQWYVCP